MAESIPGGSYIRKEQYTNIVTAIDAGVSRFEPLLDRLNESDEENELTVGMKRRIREIKTDPEKKLLGKSLSLAIKALDRDKKINLRSDYDNLGEEEFVSRLVVGIDTILRAELVRRGLGEKLGEGGGPEGVPEWQSLKMGLLMYGINERDVRDFTGLELGMSRAQQRYRLGEAVTMWLTDPRGRQTRSMYGIDTILSSPDTRSNVPTNVGEMVQGYHKITQVAAKLRTSLDASNDMLPGITGDAPEGSEMRGVISGLKVHRGIHVKGHDKPVYAEVGVGRAADFLLGNTGATKRENGERVYVATRTPKDHGGRAVVLFDVNGHPIPLNSEFTKSSLNSETRQVFQNLEGVQATFKPSEDPQRFESTTPGEHLLTITSWKKKDSGSAKWIEFLLREAGVDEKEIEYFDSLFGVATERNNRIDRDSLAVSGLPESKRGSQIVVDQLAIRDSWALNCALSVLDITNLSAYLDEALQAPTDEIPEFLIKALLGEAYEEKYDIDDPELRRLVISMFADVMGRNIKYDVFEQSLKYGIAEAEGNSVPQRDRRRVDSILDPFQVTGKEMYLGGIKLSPNAETREKQVKLLRFIRYSRRELRREQGDEYAINRIIKTTRGLVEEGKPIDEVREYARNYRKKALESWDERSSVYHLRSRQEMLAMINGMSAEERELIKDIDFSEAIQSLGIRHREGVGWEGLLSFAEAMSIEHFDWDATYKIILKQFKYMAAAGEAFKRNMSLSDAFVHAMDDRFFRNLGLDVGKGGNIFKPDSLFEGLSLQTAEGIMEWFYGVLTAQEVQKWLGEVREAVVGSYKVASWLSADANRQVMRDIALTLNDVFEGHMIYAYRLNTGRGPGDTRYTLELDLNNPSDQEALKILRENGFGVGFPVGSKPYPKSYGGIAAYDLEGKYSGKESRWAAEEPNEQRKKPLEKYGVSKVALFKKEVVLRLTEMSLRDVKAFDAYDRAYLLNLPELQVSALDKFEE